MCTIFLIVKPEKIKSFDGCLIFKNSVFGYLVTGTIKSSNCSHFNRLMSERKQLDIIKNFYDLESFNGDKYIGNSKYSKTVKNQHSNKHINSIDKDDESRRQFTS